MRHEDLSRHNAWCAWLDSPAFAAINDAATQRLTRVLGCPVSVRTSVCGTDGADRAGGAAGGTPFSLEVSSSRGARVVLASSRLLPALVLRLVTGSERLAVSTPFCGAALDLAVLHVVAAWPGLSGANSTVHRASPAATGRFTGFRVTLTAGGESADLFVLVPAAVDAPRASERGRAAELAVPAAVCLEIEPIETGRLRDLMPGDVVTIQPGATAPPILGVDLGDGRAIEWLIDAEAFAKDRTVTVASEPMEVLMNEAKIEGRNEGPGAPPPRALDDLKLPARLEVAAFDLPVAEVARLAPGQVIAWRDGSARTVKMFVCGTLFAEGTIETHEGFHGFRVEKIH